jgi:lipopolysaccharide/colanic/teichoic acid biosynthesis glycosyltransferase
MHKNVLTLLFVLLVTCFLAVSASPPVQAAATRYNAVWRPGTTGEIQVYGWNYADYRAKYDELWPQGWRLYILQAYVLNGQVIYNAVWRPGTTGEIQVYGWNYADYRAKYDELWPQGWRLYLLDAFVN